MRPSPRAGFRGDPAAEVRALAGDARPAVPLLLRVALGDRGAGPVLPAVEAAAAGLRCDRWPPPEPPEKLVLGLLGSDTDKPAAASGRL